MSRRRPTAILILLGFYAAGCLQAVQWSAFASAAIEGQKRIRHPREIVIELTVSQPIPHGILRILYTRLKGNRRRTDKREFMARLEHQRTNGELEVIELPGRTRDGQWNPRFLIEGTNLEVQRRYDVGDQVRLILTFGRMPAVKKRQIVDARFAIYGFEEWDLDGFLESSGGLLTDRPLSSLTHLSADVEMNSFPSQREESDDHPEEMFTTILVDREMRQIEACIFYQHLGRQGWDPIEGIRTTFEIFRADGSHTTLESTLAAGANSNCSCASERIALGKGDVVMSNYRFVGGRKQVNNLRIGTFLSARAVCNSRGY